jgi:SAM-dependent methyltransferase
MDGLRSISRGLLEGPGSLRHMILHHLGPVNWNLMSNLDHAVMTGSDAFSDKYGKPIYEFLKDQPDESALFDRSMSNLSGLGLSPILNAYDFSNYGVITDIGGGEGFLLANILQNNPGSRGVLFDTPQATEKAPGLFSEYKVDQRIEIIPGDFFNSIPGSGDLLILKNIIHNWDDKQALDLLKNINRAIRPGSRVLIIEMIVPPGNRPSLAKLLDIQMMATMLGGKERTANEYRVLLEKSGFELAKKNG